MLTLRLIYHDREHDEFIPFSGDLPKAKEECERRLKGSMNGNDTLKAIIIAEDLIAYEIERTVTKKVITYKY